MKKIVAWLKSINPIYYFIVIGLLIYANSLVNGFVADDNNQIINNIQVHSIWNIGSFFTQSTFYDEGSKRLVGLYYKPIFTTSLSIIYTFFGSNPSAFHFIQILMHIVNAILLFRLMRKFFKTTIAFFLSLIFLVHPINSESVLYISAMQEVLFFMFGIIALLLLTNLKSRKRLIVVSVFLLLSILAKETGILFICISGVYVFMYKRNYFLPFVCYVFILLGIYFLLRVNAINAHTSLIIDVPVMELSLGKRLLHIPAIIAFYLRTFLIPLNLSMAYYWVINKIDLHNFVLPLIEVGLSGVVLVWFGFMLKKNYSSKYISIYLFFSIWFLLGLLLHIQIYPLDQTVAERWFYFPIVGVLGLIGTGLEVLPFKIKTKWALLVAIPLVLLLSVRTFLRTYDWRNDSIAFHDSKKNSNTHTLEFMLTAYYFNNGKYNEAKRHAQNAVELYPSASSYQNLGLLYYSIGDFNLAKKAYMKSLKYRDDQNTYTQLAMLALKYGEPTENIRFMRNISLKKFPENASVWFSLAILEYNFGSKENARMAIVKANQYEPSQKVGSVYKAILNNEPVPIDLKRQ